MIMTIKQLEEVTKMAYSYEGYSPSGWRGAIKVLRDHGLNTKEVQAWMRSKHTRWAGDFEDKRTYGNYNGQTVARYIESSPKSISKEELDMLVAGTPDVI